MITKDSLGVGLYTVSEAARLLRTPRRTLSRWVEGYVAELRDGAKRYDPVLDTDAQDALTFGDLVELMYVRGFRDAGVDLESIRRAAARYRQEWATPYPLATKKFSTDGRSLMLQEGEIWKHALTGQYRAFFEEIGKQLVHVGDLTSEWRPLGVDRAVVLDPERAFGKPIDDRSGVHTYLLAQSFEGGATAEKLAWWYGTTVDSVKDAVEFEQTWSPKKASREATAA